MIISTREVTSTQRKQIPGTSSRIGNLSNNISPKFKTLRFLLSLEKLKPHSRALPPGFKIRSRFQLSTLPTVTRPKSPENRKTRLFSPHPRPARKRRLSFFGSPPAQSSQGGQSSRLVCAQHQTSTTRARAPPPHQGNGKPSKELSRHDIHSEDDDDTRKRYAARRALATTLIYQSFVRDDDEGGLPPSLARLLRRGKRAIPRRRSSTTRRVRRSRGRRNESSTADLRPRACARLSIPVPVPVLRDNHHRHHQFSSDTD